MFDRSFLLHRLIFSGSATDIPCAGHALRPDRMVRPAREASIRCFGLELSFPATALGTVCLPSATQNGSRHGRIRRRRSDDHPPERTMNEAWRRERFLPARV